MLITAAKCAYHVFQLVLVFSVHVNIAVICSFDL